MLPSDRAFVRILSPTTTEERKGEEELCLSLKRSTLAASATRSSLAGETTLTHILLRVAMTAAVMSAT